MSSRIDRTWPREAARGWPAGAQYDARAREVQPVRVHGAQQVAPEKPMHAVYCPRETAMPIVAPMRCAGLVAPRPGRSAVVERARAEHPDCLKHALAGAAWHRMYPER